jgi:hypothetical protein
MGPTTIHGRWWRRCIGRVDVQWTVGGGARVDHASRTRVAGIRRYVAEQNGYGEEPEWGAISDPDGYRALKSIDSYQAVKDGTADYDAGHGIGPTRAQQDREAADTYAFLLWRLR